VRAAIEKHGTLNSYYLHNASVTYHMTNDPDSGMLRFEFEGTVLTDESDLNVRICDLNVELSKETCSWLNQSIVDWLAETVQRNVLVEFNRYARAGDLNKTVERLEKLQAETEQSGGFVGMYL
jgi:sugar-specific transcriptional regulator TrmB